MAFDRLAGRLVAVTDTGDGVETWTFDLCTNTWTQMHPSHEPPGFDWAELVYDIDSDVTVVVANWERDAARGQGAEVWAYELQADTWTKKGVAPTIGAFLAYDPASGLVVAAPGPDLWSYDVETDTWTRTHQANGQATGPTDNPVIAYDGSVDRLVAYGDRAGGSHEAWLFDIRTDTWSRPGAETPLVIAGYGWSAPAIAYDEAAQRTVVYGNGRFIAYDATEDDWEIIDQVLDLPSFAWDMEAYDPVNARLVGWGQGGVVDQGGVTAFDLVTCEWTVLLEPSGGQAAPSTN
jgi:hypothetical protein